MFLFPNRDGLDVITFGGGMPRASYGDRFTVSVIQGDKNHVVFDLSSKVIDFCLISECETRTTEALVVLAEEELVVIDLMSPGWPSFNSPYLASLHCSAITAQATVLVTPEVFSKIKAHSQVSPVLTKISTRHWPINGGASDAEPLAPSANRLLLLTGHEVMELFIFLFFYSFFKKLTTSFRSLLYRMDP